MLINWANKIMNRLRWKYFMGEYKPKEQEKLEKGYKLLGSVEKQTCREMRILLDTISNNKTLRDELGVNAYELFSLGNNCFVNFNDPSKIVMYKVHDLTDEKTLFGNNSKGPKLEAIKKELAKYLDSDQKYIKNFANGYIIISLPKDVDYKKLNIESDYKDLSFKSVSYDDKNSTLIIQAN